jgi:hypothetical protein
MHKRKPGKDRQNKPMEPTEVALALPHHDYM